MSTTAAALDQAAIPPGSNEELAGPPHLATQPVTQAERVSSIDILRGFSLMGILIMNITDFALPSWNYYIPLTTVKPVFNGPHWQVNTFFWFARWIFAEGKMRGLFSILFGAGIILLTERAEKRGAGVRTADIFTRRNMWLVLFGMLHCYLIWNGDILYFYGVAALLFLFPFRHCKPKQLFWTAAVVLLLNTAVVQVGQTIGAVYAKKSADKANIALAHHQALTDDQIDALKNWHDLQNRWRPDTKKLYKNIAAHQHGWLSQGADAGDAFRGETLGAYAGFGDWVGGMLLGMALFRLGFLSAKLSNRTYALTAVIGLAISWSVTLWGCWYAWRGGFDMFRTDMYLNWPYDLTRFTGAVGNAALLLLFIRLGVFRWILARIGAVGQMALSNYILTSLTMKTIFVWGPWHWYGYVHYYKLYYAVAGMWITNLIFSTIWLRYFRFGPIEWCWRSLTYWQRQPMRLYASPTTEPASPTSTALPATS
jgi:uncharacterized protein